MDTGADGVFSTHVYKWKLKTSAPFYIVPLGDIHRDSPNHCKTTFNATLRRLKKFDKDGVPYRIIGMGDYYDWCSQTERSKLSRQGELHESTHQGLDNTAMHNHTELCSKLEFTRGKWIGAIQGNHYWRYLTGAMATAKGETSDTMLADYMGCQWLGWAAYVRVAIEMQGKRTNIDMFVSHGKGGGQLIGSPYNTVDKMRNIFPQADLYMMGHDHSKGTLPKTTLRVAMDHKSSKLAIKDSVQLVCRTGSFLKAYEDGEPNYVTRPLWAPSSLGNIEIECKLTNTWIKGGDQVRGLRLQMRGIA